MSLLLLDSPTNPPQPRSAATYASMLKGLLPPGRLWRMIGSKLEALWLACSDELVRIDERAYMLRVEADPRTTVELLPDFEADLELDADGLSFDERRARVIARRTRTPDQDGEGFRPADFQAALAPLLNQAPADVVVIETSRAYCILVGDDREIIRFFVYRDPAAPGTYFLASAQELLDEMKPSHTIGHVIESINFLTDDPFSLTDRDILGA